MVKLPETEIMNVIMKKFIFFMLAIMAVTLLIGKRVTVLTEEDRNMRRVTPPSAT